METNNPASQDPETRSEAVGSLSQELEEIKRRAAEENQRTASSNTGRNIGAGTSGKLIILGAMIFLIVAALFVINIIRRSPGLRVTQTQTQESASPSPALSDESEPVLVDTGSGSTAPGTTLYTESGGLYAFSYPSTSIKRVYFESGFPGVEIQSSSTGSKSKIQVIYISGKETDAKKEAEDTYLKAKPYVRSTDTLSALGQTAVGDKSGYFYTIISSGGEARDYFVDVKDGVVRIKVIISGKSDKITAEKEAVDKIIKSFDFIPGTATKGGV